MICEPQAEYQGDIHVFQHHAMATHFQVRIARGDQSCASSDRSYAAQAAQAAFALAEVLESQLSRFRPDSDISRLARLVPGQSQRVSEPVFACLELAQKMAAATRGAFSVTAMARATQPVPPEWTLENFSVRCHRGPLQLDLGAIGKGFALDRMAATLRDWSCPAFLLVAGGSSIVAGDPPAGAAGWSCGLGGDDSPCRYWLKNASLSGSGLAVKGNHIVDSRTGQPAGRRSRAWALCHTGAESDALSTACMVLPTNEIIAVLDAEQSWLVFLEDNGHPWPLGQRTLPAMA